MSVELKEGMTYRTLRLGEVLREGDEFWGASGSWQKTNSAGGKVDAMDFAGDMRYRRPVTPPKPINYERLCKRMAKAPSIREVRAIYERAVKRG